MFTAEILSRARQVGVPDSELSHLVVCVHSKTVYLSPEQAMESCLKAYSVKGYPTEVPAGESELTSGTRAPEPSPEG